MIGPPGVAAHAGFPRMAAAPVSPGRAYIALADLSAWQPWLSGAYALLDPAEAGRVASRRFERDRNALALAYALHRQWLAALLGTDPERVALGRDDRGCPRLGDGAGYTSLSHSGDYAAFGFCVRAPLGVDVEPRARASDMGGIARLVCTAAEARALDQAGPDRDAALLALWVRKEALLKAAGVGLAHEMTGFAVPDGDEVPVPVPWPGGGGGSCVRMFTGDAGCVAAAAAAPGLPVSWDWLHPPQQD